MTVQTSKNPQVDIAEDNAFFPSEYSLSQYTSPVSDLDGVDYPKPYRGKHKILVIAADERYLPTDNGKLFSTGIRLKRCCRCIISMLQVSNSKWRPFPV